MLAAPQCSGNRSATLQPNVWLTTIGPEYIQLAFEQARETDPRAHLILHEWGADYFRQEHGPTNRPQRYYNLVKELLAQGAPIDGVGFRFHREAKLSKPAVARIVDNFARYHGLGRSIHLTEPDVRVRGPITETKREEQSGCTAPWSRPRSRACPPRAPCCRGSPTAMPGSPRALTTTVRTFPDHLVGTLLDNDFRYFPSFPAVREALSASAA